MPREIDTTPYEPKEIEDILTVIIERLEGGESLNKICSDDDMPTRATVMKWLKSRPEYAEQYAHAREEGAESLMERLQSISDDVLSGTITPEQGRVVINSLQWLIIKMKPQKYGDKPSTLTINNNTDNRKVDISFEEMKMLGKDQLNHAKQLIKQKLDGNLIIDQNTELESDK